MIKIINKMPALPYKPREVDEPLEDIHRAKVYSLLKPWHPFFRFEVLRENKSGSIDFRISLNKAFNSKHSLIGCFYWPGHNYEQFSDYVFACLRAFIFSGDPGIALTSGGAVNWQHVSTWILSVTDSLSKWFERKVQDDDDQLIMVISPLDWKGSNLPEPVCLFRIPKAAIAAECLENSDKAERMIVLYLQDMMINGLYNMRFKL